MSCRAIAQCFGAFLKTTVELSDLQIVVKYTASTSSAPDLYCPVVLQESMQRDKSFAEALDLNIVSPLFYSNLVRHSHITEFIMNSLLTTPANAQTFYVSDYQAFIRLFDARPRMPGPKENPLPRSAIDALRWQFLHRLRNLCPRTHTTSAAAQTATRAVQDIRPFPRSMLDEFAQRSKDTGMASRYRKAAVKLLMSDMITFGQPAVLDALDWLIRVVLCFTFVRSLSLSTSQVAKTGDGMHSDLSSQYADLLKAVPGFAGTHLWWAFKALF